MDIRTKIAIIFILGSGALWVSRLMVSMLTLARCSLVPQAAPSSKESTYSNVAIESMKAKCSDEQLWFLEWCGRKAPIYMRKGEAAPAPETNHKWLERTRDRELTCLRHLTNAQPRPKIQSIRTNKIGPHRTCSSPSRYTTSPLTKLERWHSSSELPLLMATLQMSQCHSTRHLQWKFCSSITLCRWRNVLHTRQ